MKLIFFICLITTNIVAQIFSIQGVVKDSETSESLPLANIYISELNIGVTTNELGEFLFNKIKKGQYTLKVTFIGYETEVLKFKLNTDKKLEIFLTKVPILLDRTVIEGTYPKFRETAVAFSELIQNDFTVRLGAKEAINALEGIPSAYISQQGGGIGEQRLNLRGFDQTNIAVMINGVPINNPENGEIYWSNWAGIADVVNYIHVQRGLSAIPYSTSSIGGNVNIVTTGAGINQHKYRFKSEIGSYGLRKGSISFSSKISNEITFTGLISKRELDGYADEVFSDELTYYLSLGMFLEKHSLQIQLFGSPQKHGQRLTPQLVKDWKILGKKFNADWGYLNGKPLNLRDNEFHNPTININYSWQIGRKTSLSNIISLSRGSGGGTVPPWYPTLSRTENGLIDFDREWQINTNNIDTDYHPTKNRSIIALRKGIHKNYWGNLISVLKHNWNSFTISGGIDAKLYEAQNYNELSNLLGGDYYIGSGNINADYSTLLQKGDKVDFNADSFLRSFGGFFQAEFNVDQFTTYVNLAITNTSYNRIDYFNYLETDTKRETGWNSFTSSTIKLGMNYNLNSYNNFYFNIGNYSRAPLSQNVYDYGNNIYENVKNEKIFSFEIGYGFKNDFALLNINYFNTFWDDKAFSQSYLNNDSTTIYYYNIFGASANHTGVEIDGYINLANNIRVNGMLSYSINKWTSDVDAFVRPESNPLDEIKYHAFTKDLYVGNFPMNQVSLGLHYSDFLSKNIEYYFNPVYNFYGKYYANFLPEKRTIVDQRDVQPWRIPDFYNFDLHFGMHIDLDYAYLQTLGISINIFNVFDNDYITDAIDGFTHDSSSALVWYGKERWWSTSISFMF